MKIKDLMSTSLETVGPEAPLQEAAIKMMEANVGILPVIENEQLVGVLTDRDLVIRGMATPRAAANVRQAMTSNPITKNEEAEVDQAIETMEACGIGRLMITDSSGKLRGIRTASDIAIGLAGDARTGRLSAQLGLKHRMSEEIVSA